MHSLRQKIAFAYYAIGALIVGLSLFVFVELRLIESKVLSGERVAEMLNLTLEIRRFEKNYFLYKQQADGEENQAYVGLAQQQLRENFADFVSLSSAADMLLLRDHLTEYARLMTDYLAVQPSPDASGELETRIRRVGKDLVTLAENVAKAERVSLKISLERHRLSLGVSIALLIALVILIGHMLSRMVSRPLRLMEVNMQAVANGSRSQIAMATDDREVVSLTNAINHVLLELEQRQRHLVRSEKLASLGTLLSGVAHELNNPLSNISTSCQILLEDLDDPGPLNKDLQREMLAQIDEQTIRARNIVRALLDFARDRAFNREPLQLALLVSETLGFIRGQIPSQVEISLEIPDSIYIQGDKQRLQQVFLNLVNNAIEALEGAGDVKISAQRLDERHARENALNSGLPLRCLPGGDVVEILIEDNGHGIAPEILSRIFDPFFTTRDVGKGSGLGLFVVYEIIEEHGGCIVAESKPENGALFRLLLPLKNKDED
jgi:two-component system NtrC family sensor kinase